MADKITSFQGEHRFLSNFWPVEVELDGVVYPSVEHAYQAAKTTNIILRQTIRDLPTPGKAKRFIKGISFRRGWGQIKVQVMADLVRQKFSQEPLRQQLLDTGDAKLIEGNTWGDVFWGAVWNDQTKRWKGQNNLGKLLMKVRENLRQEELCIASGQTNEAD